MNIYIIVVHAVMLLCAAFGFVYGVKYFFKRGAALFAQLITCSLACFGLCHLFCIVLCAVDGEIADGFNVSQLGMVGGFLFMLSASYGQMDDLSDSSSEQNKKYRVIALVAPVIVAVIAAFAIVMNRNMATRIISLIMYVFIGFAAYFNLKHLIIPDVENGILKAVRQYNFIALVLELMTALEIMSGNLNWNIAEIVFSGICAAAYAVMIPILKKGVVKWTI